WLLIHADEAFQSSNGVFVQTTDTPFFYSRSYLILFITWYILNVNPWEGRNFNYASYKNIRNQAFDYCINDIYDLWHLRKHRMAALAWVQHCRYRDFLSHWRHADITQVWQSYCHNI